MAYGQNGFGQRDALRQRLESLGFVRLQKSLWVHPHPCFEEVKTLSTFYNIAGFIKFAVVDEFDTDAEQDLKKSFNL